MKVNFFAESLRAFKKIFIPLFAIILASNSIDQYLNLHIETALRNPDGAQKVVYVFGFLSLLNSIFLPIIGLAIAIYGFSAQSEENDSLGLFLGRHLNQLYIETLRSWGKTMLWSLLFILPGMWKYLELSLVPLIVTTSPQYKLGNVDALEKSAKIVRKNWGKILLIFIFFHIFIPLLTSTLFDSHRLIWKTPFSSMALSALDTYLLLFSTHILFFIFKQEENYVPNI